MIDLQETIRQLTANAEAMRALLQSIPDPQARWEPGPEIWSLQQVMGHIDNEERVDFRKHLKEMFSSPPAPWQKFREGDFVAVSSCQQALQDFLAEREASTAWLLSLDSPDWDISSEAPWGTIRAGDVLVAWIEHDFLHMRQLIEVLYTWNVTQAAPYSVQYAGDW